MDKRHIAAGKAKRMPAGTTGSPRMQPICGAPAAKPGELRPTTHGNMRYLLARAPKSPRHAAELETYCAACVAALDESDERLAAALRELPEAPYWTDPAERARVQGIWDAERRLAVGTCEQAGRVMQILDGGK